METCCEGISVNDQRMFNNEILKTKTFAFPLKNNRKYFLGKEGLEFQTLSTYIELIT